MFGKGHTAFVWMLSALVLTLGQEVNEVQDITSSLKCLTDYKYKIECQWVEDTAAKRYIPMDLYYQRSSTVSNCSQRLCNRMGTSTTTSSTESHCTIKNTFFAVGIEYTFTFKPKNPISLNKSFRLMENIKLQSPHGLTVNVTETGDYLLSWETIYTGNSSNIRLGTLQYEVNYKRTWESWENSVSETITGGSRQLEINSSALRSADTYVARVRMRPLQSTYRHLWSAWSSQVQWNVMTSEVDSQTAEAEVMPQNLQCAYNGIQQIECTWEVMRESSKYFSFKLHYKKASSSETQECQTSVIVRTYPHLTVHRCNIPVPDQEDFENYEVFLKLVNPSMKYRPYKNIKPIAPYNLTSKELPDGRFQLEWNTIEALYGLNYEINYKKADKSWEDTKVKMIPQDTRTFILPKDSLEPSSQYLVRVRAKVYCEPTEVECYSGPWSDWSLSVQLNTGPDKEIPIIVACILMVLFFILSPATFMLVKRKKRLWLESIPDPAKSRLFHKDTQTAPLRPLAAIEPVTLEEGNICKVVTAGSSAASPQVTPRVKADYSQKEEEQDHSTPPVISNSRKQAKGYQGLTPETGTSSASEAECPILQIPLSEPTNYNGPYLFNFQDISSILSALTELKTATSKNANYFKRGQDAPGYVKLPSEGVQAMDQCNPEPAPSLPPAAYVLNPPVTSKAADHYLHADKNARALSSQKPFQPPVNSTSDYTMSSPPTNCTPTTSPQLTTDYIHAKDTDASQLSQPISGTANLQLTSSNHGLVSKAVIAVDNKTQDTGSTSQDLPTVAPWPATCSGYVLSPPCEEVHISITPTLPKSTELEDQSLSADPQPGTKPQPLTRATYIDHAPEGPPLSKHQVDPQKPTGKEQEHPLSDMENNEAPEVILYQQGAKPILFQQIGDYCFLPGSYPTKSNEFTKGDLSPSPTNPKPADKCLDFQGNSHLINCPLPPVPLTTPPHKVG